MQRTQQNGRTPRNGEGRRDIEEKRPCSATFPPSVSLALSGLEFEMRRNSAYHQCQGIDDGTAGIPLMNRKHLTPVHREDRSGRENNQSAVDQKAEAQSKRLETNAFLPFPDPSGLCSTHVAAGAKWR